MKQRESLKLHYGKYLYKICLINQLSNLFGSYRTKQNREDILKELQYNYDNNLALHLKRRRTTTVIDKEDFENAKFLKKLFEKYTDHRKRVEFANRLIIYTNSKDMLDEIIDKLESCVKEIYKPKEGIEGFLTQNIETAIVKTPTEYEFRVYLNGNRIDPNFANWLRSNRDKCKVGEATLWNIENDNFLTNNNYFYIKNEKVLTMIRMIIGHNIRKVERLVYLGDIDKYTYADNK